MSSESEEDLVGQPQVLLTRGGVRVYDGFQRNAGGDEEISESSSSDGDDDEVDEFLGEGSDDMADLITAFDGNSSSKKKNSKKGMGSARPEGFHQWDEAQRSANANTPGLEHEYGVLPDDDGDSGGRGPLSLKDLIGSASSAVHASSLVEGQKELLEFDKRLILPKGLSGAREAKKHQRQVAKELARKEVSKWVPTVKMVERANQHFPLQEKDEEPEGGKDLRNVAARFSADAVESSPSDSVPPQEGEGESGKAIGLEAKINQLLQQSGVSNGNTDTIDLEPNRPSAAEVRARRDELRRIRYKMMYKHQKAARQKKIKSKKYRRLLRKQKDKEALSDQQLLDADELTAKEMANKAERERIRERVTQRHRNTGKWVQHKMKRGADGISTEEKAALSVQLRRHHELLQKQYDMTGDASIPDGIDVADDDADEDVPTKGLFAMEFMKRPAQRAKAKLERAREKLEEERRMLEEAREEARLADGDSGERTETHFEDIEPKRVALLPSSRMELTKKTFGSRHAARASGPLTVNVDHGGLGFQVAPFPDDDDEDDEEAIAANLNKKILPVKPSDMSKGKSKRTRSGDGKKRSKRKKEHARNASDDDEEEEDISSNERDEKKRKGSKKKRKGKKNSKGRERDDDSDDDGDDDTSVSISSIEKRGDESGLPQPSSSTKDDDDDESNVQLDPTDNPWLLPNNSSSGSTKKKEKKAKQKKRKKAKDDTASIDDGVGSENGDEVGDDTEENSKIIRAASIKKKKKRRKKSGQFNLLDNSSNEQRALIQVAFDKDEVLDELERERDEMKKRKEAERSGKAGDKPPVVPGWGTWTGPGTTTTMAHEDKVGPSEQSQRNAKRASKRKRKTSEKDRVVVRNTKPTSKQWAKFTSSGIIQDRTISKNVHNRAIRHPLGPEWNPPSAHKRLVEPKVTVRPGSNIEPLSEQKDRADFRAFIRKNV